MAPIVKVYPDAEALVEAAVNHIVNKIDRAVKQRGIAVLLLSGGQTPTPVYRRMASPPWNELMPWDKIHFFWVDERWVPPSHDESNFGMVWRSLLSRVPVPPQNIHSICTCGIDPMVAAKNYEQELRKTLGIHDGVIDLAIMGMGEDGHTASLFPGSAAMSETTRFATVAESPAGVKTRITLTLPVLNQAKMILFLVTGANKRKVVERILKKKDGAGVELPAARVGPSGEIVWMLDRLAAGQLPNAAQ